MRRYDFIIVGIGPANRLREHGIALQLDPIKGAEPPPPSNAPFYCAEDWQQRQRRNAPVRVPET